MQETEATMMHIAALEEGAGGGMAQLIYLVVDIGVFLDIGSVLGHIGFGLVVIVIADEVLHGVIGEELLELLESWAASVLLWLMTRVGRCTRWMTLAMVKVLPLPVTPSRVCFLWLCLSPSTSFSTAWGWSPVSPKSETILKSGMVILSLGLKTIHNHCIILGFCRQSAMSLKSWFKISCVSGALFP